jgi:hypothetical protein
MFRKVVNVTKPNGEEHSMALPAFGEGWAREDRTRYSQIDKTCELLYDANLAKT